MNSMLYSGLDAEVGRSRRSVLDPASSIGIERGGREEELGGCREFIEEQRA